jgi:hypothetical protein
MLHVFAAGGNAGEALCFCFGKKMQKVIAAGDEGKLLCATFL